jgi:hypothetical protein
MADFVGLGGARTASAGAGLAQPFQGADQPLARVGAVCSLVGAVVLFVATLLHPMGADPNDAPAAFAEYAADTLWVWSHLGQFAGISILSMAMVALTATFEPGRAAAWGKVGVVGMAATVAVAAALQAVDGVALKALVDRWIREAGEARDLAFEAAFAARQIEIGMASLLSIQFGITAAIFGFALRQSARYPAWVGTMGLAVGLGMIAAGGAQAKTGFSGLAMMLSMSASSLSLVWVIALGAKMWALSVNALTPRSSEGG